MSKLYFLFIKRNFYVGEWNEEWNYEKSILKGKIQINNKNYEEGNVNFK